MRFFAPDIMEQACGLSVGLCAAGLGLGLLLWLTGWLGHRFWIVLCTTAAAGIFGLLSPPASRLPPLALGLLLALAAGVLALALVRVVAFAAGGAAACLAVRTLAPPTWDEPLVWFLVGGLLALLLFRLWMMALTSFAGTLLMGYSALCLADRLDKVNAVDFTEQRVSLPNWLCAGVTLAGLTLQFLIDRRRVRYERWRERSRHLAEEEVLYGRRWWNLRRSYRRAG